MKVLLFSAALALSVVGAELVLRFLPSFAPQPRFYVGDAVDRPVESFVPDPELGWRLRPGGERSVDTEEYQVVYRADAEGFRTGERAPVGARGHIVAIAGDSFAFGQGVAYEQTFAARLEAGLHDTAVRNFALPGYGIDQMWLTVRKLALPLAPTLVVVAFISEDWTRSLNAYRPDLGITKPVFRIVDGVLRPRTREDAPPAWFRLLEAHSRLWAGLFHARRLLAHRVPVGEWWELNRALLDAIRADCAAAGTRVLFVYLPTREPRSFASLRDYMDETGADFLDLGHAPRESSPMLHHPVDGHPNAHGHRHVADALLAWVGREMPALIASAGPSVARPQEPDPAAR